MTSEAQSCLGFLFVSFLSNPPQLPWNSIRSLGSAAAAATVLLRTSQGMLWLRGSNSHSHTPRWRDVALLIRGLHLYSQPWSHLKAYAIAQLCLNVLFSLFSVIPTEFMVSLFNTACAWTSQFLSAFLYVNTYTFVGFELCAFTVDLGALLYAYPSWYNAMACKGVHWSSARCPTYARLKNPVSTLINIPNPESRKHR